MKVAVSTDNNQVAQHFGRCPKYTLAVIEDGSVKETDVIDNPGHEPGFLPRYLSDKGVSCIIAGGMGQRAQSLFKERSIDTITGVTGDVDTVLSSYAAGTLSSGEDLCEH